MLRKWIGYASFALVAFVLVCGTALISGCEPKREKKIHRQTEHKDVVVEEGPVVE